MAKLSTEAQKKSPFEATLGSQRKFKSYSGRFGVELELEGTGLRDEPIKGWVQHEEGSLRNGGTEWVLEQPRMRQALGEAMRELNAVLTRPGKEVILSHRASTHIHINMQKETLRTVFNYVCLFTILDPLVCRLAGTGRDGNLFCLSSHDTGNLANIVERMVAYASVGMLGNWPQRGKYASLNMNTLMSFGSLEVRVFPPTISPADVSRWTGWLENLLELARETKTDRELRDHIDLGMSNPGAIIRHVFGQIELSPEEAHETIKVGCQHAYEVYRAIRSGRSAETQEKLVGMTAKTAGF